MSYIGAQPTTAAFITDQFNGTGSQTAFTLSVAPATTSSILVSVSGVLQDPSTYSVSGTTLTFSAAPPAGTGNISVRFLGIPASGVVNTAYRTQTEFTATAGQTTFSVPSYTVGYIDVYRNGALLGSADFTATNGTTVVLAAGASAGDLIETVSFYVSSVLNAIPATSGAVTSAYLLDGSVTAAKMGANGTWAPAGTVLQVVNATSTSDQSTTSTSYSSTGLSASITPKFSTSKILVMLSACGGKNGSSGGSVQIWRGGSSICLVGDNLGFDSTSNNTNQPMIVQNYLDSPATTSSTTYTIYFRSNSSGQTFKFGVSSAVQSLTLMEIAA